MALVNKRLCSLTDWRRLLPCRLPAIRRRPVDTRGSVLIFTTLWLFVVFAVASLSVDAGYWYYVRFQEQSAADAAAIAGAVTLGYPNATDAGACAAASRIAAMNGFDTGATGCTDTGNGYAVTITPNLASQTVTAAISETGATFFSIAFGLISAAPTIAAQATAAIGQDTSNAVCILALNGQAVINLLNITIRDCTIASNSTAVDAVQLSLAQVSYIHSLYSAGGICMVGTPSCQPNLLGELTTATGIQALLNDLLLKFQTPPKEFQLPVNNPFVPLNNLSFNTPGMVTNPTPSLLSLPLVPLTATYYPGIYTYPLAINAAIVHFAPGVYVFQKGLAVEGALNLISVAVTGACVSFVVTGGTVTLNAGVALDLSAPTPSGANCNGASIPSALQGVLLDVQSTDNSTITLGSLNVLNYLQGAIYAPNAPVSLGLISINLTLFPTLSPCEVVVAQSVTLPTAEVDLTLPTAQAACQSDGVPIPYPQYVELTQ